MDEAREQMRKAGAYFGTVLRENGRPEDKVIACRVNGVTIVIAEEPDGGPLERWTNEHYRHVTVEHPPAEGMPSPAAPAPAEQKVVLIPRYHVPSSQVYPGSRGGHEGNVHLHVLHDVKLKRRVRTSGQCLCSKKKGSNERSPEVTETKMCPECVKVAADNGIEWSLT